MSKWISFYDKWVVSFLVKEPMKHGSYFLSHGGVHLIVCIIVFFLTYQWAKLTVNSTDTTVHNINIGMNYDQENIVGLDTLTVLGYEFRFDSDSILKESKGKYKSKLVISYAYDWNHGHAKNENNPRGITTIDLYSNPQMDDLLVNQDSVWYEFAYDTIRTANNSYYTKSREVPHVYETFCYDSLLNDGSHQVRVKPCKNMPMPDRMTEGTQIINFYSNKWGLNSHDSFWKKHGFDMLDKLWNKLGFNVEDAYYNYYVGFGFLPIATNTDHYSGYQSISFTFGDFIIKNSYYHNPNKKLLYQYVYPKPDIINNGFVYYQQSIPEVAKNHGIIIQAVDVEAQNRNNRKSIIFSVLVGTGAALFFDILIQLIRELRNVNRRKEEQEEKEKQEEQNDEVEECVSEVCVDSIETTDDESQKCIEENFLPDVKDVPEEVNLNNSNE